MSTISLQANKTRHDDGPPRIITFEFKKPYATPFYLGVITLTENSGLSAINGVIVAGSGSNSGGTCDLQVPSGDFSSVWDSAPAGTKPIVTLTYNSTDLSVSAVSVSAPPAFAPPP